MMRRKALSLVAFFSLCGVAQPQTLDPGGLIRPELLERAVAAMDAHGHDGRASGALVLVDYGLHSSQERLFVVDLETGAVSAFRVAHGRGSDADHDGYLDSFSGVPGSQASPEGAFRFAEEYTGRHGQSYRLDGLDAANKTARVRAIVIHAAGYAEPDFLKRHGKLGRSNGCIVFSAADLTRFAASIKQGTLIFVGR